MNKVLIAVVIIAIAIAIGVISLELFDNNIINQTPGLPLEKPVTTGRHLSIQLNESVGISQSP